MTRRASQHRRGEEKETSEEGESRARRSAHVVVGQLGAVREVELREARAAVEERAERPVRRVAARGEVELGEARAALADDAQARARHAEAARELERAQARAPQRDRAQPDVGHAVRAREVERDERGARLRDRLQPRVRHLVGAVHVQLMQPLDAVRVRAARRERRRHRLVIEHAPRRHRRRVRARGGLDARECVPRRVAQRAVGRDERPHVQVERARVAQLGRHLGVAHARVDLVLLDRAHHVLRRARERRLLHARVPVGRRAAAAARGPGRRRRELRPHRLLRGVVPATLGAVHRAVRERHILSGPNTRRRSGRAEVTASRPLCPRANTPGNAGPPTSNSHQQ